MLTALQENNKQRHRILQRISQQELYVSVITNPAPTTNTDEQCLEEIEKLKGLYDSYIELLRERVTIRHTSE